MIQQSISNWFTHAPDASTSLEGGAVLATSVGCVRETNQDRAGILRVSSAARSFSCACVCDGMGGMRDGDLAAINGISAFFSELIKSRGLQPLKRLEYAVQSANRYIAENNPGAGSTISAVLMEGPETYTLNVGDSRIFGFTESNELVRLSVDDTMKGRYGADNRGLLQHLGLRKELKPDVQRVSEKIKSILLASDGCYVIGNEAILTLRNSAPTPISFAKRAVELSKWFGGDDNSSVIYLPNLGPNLVTSGERLDVSVFSTQGRLKIDWVNEGTVRPSSEAARADSHGRNFSQKDNDPNVSAENNPKVRAEKDKKSASAKKSNSTIRSAAKPKRPETKSRAEKESNQQFSIGFDEEDDGK